jgi:hypothetical protein
MNWLELRALNDLYCNKEVRVNDTLKKSTEFLFLEQSCHVLRVVTKTVEPLPDFKEMYERLYLSNFQHYRAFLMRNDLLRPQTRMEEEDIKVLMEIETGMHTGELIPVRDQIIASEESLRGVSLMFFKHEKYLDTRTSLVEALKQLLGVAVFSNEKDQQYMYRLECHQPQAIVLCENIDFLRKPSRPRAEGIELWYAGGKNVNKLQYADARGLPIYYSCDWDYDGLFVIYPLVKEKIPSIQLLNANGIPKSISKTDHASHWNLSCRNDPASLKLFSPPQLERINQLSHDNEWIIEESNDLIKMFAETIHQT